MPDKIPEIKKENGFTTIDAVVNCHFGIAMTTAKHLVVEAQTYPNEILFYNLSDKSDYNAKSILSLIGMGVQKDDPIKIMVEGVDETAKKIALRFYSALSSKNSYNLEFDKYNA